MMEINEFGTFRSTYKFTNFVLCISMMYPHPETVKRRIMGVIFMSLSLMPLVVFILNDTFNSLLKQDLLNVTHHSTVIGPYLGGFVKIFGSLYRSKEGDDIINEINRDYTLYNTMPKSYQNIARMWINNSLKYCEKLWFFMVTLSISTYPMVSAFLNIKSQLFDDYPQKYMVHDVLVPLIQPEGRFESPVFEIIYVFMVYGTGVIMIYYLGYDSFFAIAVNHACLKIEMYCMAFEDALKCKIREERFEKIVNVINDQLRLFVYLEKIRTYFNIYLGVVLFATLIQIGTCLYHITESEEFDLQYMMIACCSIGAIFLPCTYATKLKFKSQESAVQFYCAGWENIHCISTRRTILFMIARAQIPLVILGFNCIIFDMDLFVSILQSAYSIYTLLCS